MEVGDLYFLMIGLFVMGVLSVFFTKDSAEYTNKIAHSIAGSGCLTAILCAILVFKQGAVEISLFSYAQVGMITATIDRLSAYFMLAVGVVGLTASIYAVGYCKEYYNHRLSLLTVWYNAFLLLIFLVLTVSNIFGFIIVWEMMSVASFFLVSHEHKSAANRRAAYVYLLMTHIGTAFIITAFLILSSGSSLNFSELRAQSLSPVIKNIVFLCAFVGFGTKAGIMPLHVWLPEAHPIAPSHVSALMSGVMIKTAIYGMIRFFLDFLGAGPLWWGSVVSIVAVICAVLGVLYALMERDLKRVLAYSSIENIGIILLGVGAGLIFMAQGKTVPAYAAWTAALLHVFNHAVFKSLLFLGAGAVVQASGTKDIEKLGGMIKTMPYTAGCFLVGCMAITALPPLNGFVSEWLTFQALLLLVWTGAVGKLWGSVLIALLGLTGALAAACFVKIFGIVFLGKARDERINAGEAEPVMLFGMSLLCILCVGLGVLPSYLMDIAGNAISAINTAFGFISPQVFQLNWLVMTYAADGSAGSFSAVTVMAILIVAILGASALYHFSGRPQSVVGETWTCGIIPFARMQYSGTGFSKPIRTAFNAVLRSQRETIVDTSPSKYYGTKLSYHVGIRYVFNDLYRPINSGILSAARFMKNIQAGSVQLYIAYIAVTTVLVLGFSLWGE